MVNRYLLMLSERALVISVGCCLLLLINKLSTRAWDILFEVWLDTSVELHLVASISVILLSRHVRRTIEDVLRGLGLGERSSRTASGLFPLIFTIQQTALGRLRPGTGRLLINHQLLANCIDHWVDPHRAYPPSLKSADKTLPHYKYGSLWGARAIRLITLKQCDDPKSPIICQMEEVGLDSGTPFTALSYAWDSHHGTEQIVCDGHLITVTKNCVAALRSARHEGREGRIWVDAICINQMDNEEKTRQIGILGDIYRTAADVRVWLGEHDDSSSLACEFFSKVATAGVIWHQDREEYRDETEEVGFDMAGKWPQLGSSLADFFHRSWFTRAWPVQEVTLPGSGRVTLVCGDARLKFESIRIGWKVLKDLGAVPLSIDLDQALSLQFYLADAIALKRGANAQNNNSTDELRLQDLSQFSFTSVMNSMRFKGCRDPKDRFFSLYGVFQELEVDHGIPISMWVEPDAKVFEAVALACFKLDGTLDAVRLAQLPDPYLQLSNNLSLPARRDPYDSLSASMFAMSRRVWRVLANIWARKEACYDPATEWLTDLPSWIPDWTQSISSQIYSARQISLLDRFTPSVELPGPEDTDYNINGPNLNTKAKIIGHVAEIGTVDSVELLWQLLESTFYADARRPRTTPDPIISAVAETVINLLWRSYVDPIFLSMSMAFRTLNIFDILAYLSSAYTSRYFTIRGHELLCMRFPSVASCPTDGHRMQLNPRWKREYATEISAMSQALQVFINGRTWILRDMWRQSAGEILFTIGRLLWEFRVSVIETLFGTSYDNMNWIIVLPVLGHLISASTQFVAAFMGETSIFLLAWSLGALANIGFIFAFVAWTWKIFILPVAVIISLRVYCGPLRFLGSLTRIARFRQDGAYTQGMHFFVTETGITGSTSGPVRSLDCLAVISGATGYLVLRPKGDGYVVVGAAFVGSRPKSDKLLAEASWTQIRLC